MNEITEYLFNRDYDEELTDEAINGYVDKMLRKLSFTMGIELRS